MAYVGKITGTDGTTGLVGSTLYGTCSTAADTAAKVVTCSAFDNLMDGVTIHVFFTNSNTASAPTLNVNSTGAKAIKRYGTTAPGTTVATSWPAGAVISLTYDNTNSFWRMNDHMDDTDTKVTQTADNSSNSDSYELLVSNSANNTTETAGVRKSSRLRFNPSNGRVIMQGTLVVRATDNSTSNLNAGIRINAGKAGWSSLTMGGAQDSDSGTSDGTLWIATNRTDDTYKRKLYIAHNGTTESKTYFYAESSSQKTPSLRVGGDVFVTPSASDAGCKMRYNSTTQSLDFVFV